MTVDVSSLDVSPDLGQCKLAKELEGQNGTKSAIRSSESLRTELLSLLCSLGVGGELAP